MSRVEYVSPEGLRLDGRRPNEARTMNARMGILPNVDGSAIFELGNTRVLATVNGPREPRQRSQAVHDRVAISVRFHAATFSSAGGERRRRPARGDRRLTEWGNLLVDTFEMAIIGNLYPRSQIEIYVEVLNADGSVLAAAINATTLALINAGIPLYDYVVATSVGFLAKTALLDVNRMEEAGAANPTLTLATYGRHPERALLMTADARVGADGLECMTEVAKTGIRTIFDWLDESVVRPATSSLAVMRAASGKSEIKG